MMHRRILLAALCALLASPGTAPAQLFGSSTRPKEGNMKMPGAPYKGIKHAVAVREFDNEAGWHGQWELGDNLSMLLESALFDTGRFVLVEREQLGDVILEQDLAASGRTAAAGKVAQTGKLRSAKYLATGAVVEVEDAQAGGDAGVRIKGFRIGLGGQQAQIAIIAKLIDTTTGEIVAKQRIVGNPAGGRVRMDYFGSDVGVDLGGFVKTPLGQAAQDCINKAAKWFAQSMEAMPLEGSVVKVTDDGKVVVNRGEQFGIQTGQEFVMQEKGEEMIDPDTGEILGTEAGRVVGRLRVARVEEKVSYCDLIEGEGKPERGTVVLLK